MNNIAPLWKLLQITDDNPEYALFESVVEEFTLISGWPILYYVRKESENIDKLYGEDASAEWSEGFDTLLVYEPTEEETMLDSFGISSDDTITHMYIPKMIFTNDIENKFNETDDEILPKVGDCIKTLWNNNIYEIVDVGAEEKIFQGRKMIWEIIAKPFTYAYQSDSAEDIVSHIPDEDEFSDINIDGSMTDPLSAYDDADNIEDEAWNNPDSSVYGY